MVIEKSVKKAIGWAIVALLGIGVLLCLENALGWRGVLFIAAVIIGGLGLSFLLNLAINWIKGE
jgi:hypothetical protein